MDKAQTQHIPHSNCTRCLRCTGTTGYCRVALAVAQWQHLQVGDGGVIHNGDVHTETADQLQGSQAGHMLIPPQPPLEQLLIGQHEHGPVTTWDTGPHPEHLHLWFATEGEERRRESWGGERGGMEGEIRRI